MFFYKHNGSYMLSPMELTHMQRVSQEEALNSGERLTYLFNRPLGKSRVTYKLTHPGQFLALNEGISWLDKEALDSEHGEAVPKGLVQAVEQGRVAAVNVNYPHKLAPKDILSKRCRVNVVGLGDVGGALLMGLRLLGGDVISSIGIYDLNRNQMARYEMEINQISYPDSYVNLPEVEMVNEDALFDCDVFVFCATREVPPIGGGQKDVRMAQLGANSAIIRQYAKQARDSRFSGLFAVVSDPVDILCSVAWSSSNKNGNGITDYRGLRAEQIQGFGLGVMNARAIYYAQRDERFKSFLEEGRLYGPHGEDLVVANSTFNYDDKLSRELTHLAANANVKMRQTGFKPYIAPALSSAAISLILLLRGEWHYSASFLGGVYMGAMCRFTNLGIELECETLPAPLFARIAETYRKLTILTAEI